MGAKIGPKSEKGGKTEFQKSMQKMMRKMEASKRLNQSSLGRPGLVFGAGGGFGGTGETGFDSDVI